MTHLNRKLISLPQGKIKKTIAKTKAGVDEVVRMTGSMRSLPEVLEGLRLATTLAPLHYRGL